MLFTTPAIAFSAVFSLIYIYTAGREQPIAGKLPPYPGPVDGEGLRLVLGEVHHPRKATPVEHPTWLSIPARGLYTGIAVFGAIGSGKTSAALRPFASQLLSWRADDPEQKLGGIVLEVKGDSMIDAGIHPGDLVIVERKSTYKPGQIVIASVEGEYTMKYLRKRSTRPRLWDPAPPGISMRLPEQTAGRSRTASRPLRHAGGRRPRGRGDRRRPRAAAGAGAGRRDAAAER